MKKMEEDIKLLLDDKQSLVALSDFRINTFKKELTKKNKTIEELTVKCSDVERSGNKRAYAESADGTAIDDVANKAFKKDESSTTTDKQDIQLTDQQTEIENLQKELQRVSAEHEEKEEKYNKITKRGIETIKSQRDEISKLKDEISWYVYSMFSLVLYCLYLLFSISLQYILLPLPYHHHHHHRHHHHHHHRHHRHCHHHHHHHHQTSLSLPLSLSPAC